LGAGLLSEATVKVVCQQAKDEGLCKRNKLVELSSQPQYHGRGLRSVHAWLDCWIDILIVVNWSAVALNRRLSNT
jgi:hypothetical protein